MSQRRTLFVAGNARSGTTALANLLDEHAKMVVTSERFLGLSSNDQMERLTQEHFSAQIHANPVASETDTFWDESVRDKIIKKYETAEVVGDKSPTFDRHFAYISRHYESPKILYISRNIYNVVASYEVFLADPDLNWTADYKRAVADWNFSHGEMLKAAQAVPDICQNLQL